MDGGARLAGFAPYVEGLTRFVYRGGITDLSNSDGQDQFPAWQP